MAAHLSLCATAGVNKASGPLLEQLAKALEADGPALAKKIKGLVLFKIDDADWTLDLREDGQPALYSGAPKDDEKPDLTLTTSDANFAQLVMGKLNPQQKLQVQEPAFLMRKLKISGSMGMAMKLQPILDAAQPKAKL